jgi:hypothetical protein
VERALTRLVGRAASSSRGPGGELAAVQPGRADAGHPNPNCTQGWP